MYKLTSRIVAIIMRDIVELNEALSINQYGTRRQVQGSKELLLIDKCLNAAHRFQLKTCWIDIQKAFDSLDHRYLRDVMNAMCLPEYVQNFVARSMQLQQVNLHLAGKMIGTVKIESGIVQGDSLSPLLFVLAMEPISKILNSKHDVVQTGQLARNHLIFVDDIKLIAETDAELDRMCLTAGDCLERMGFVMNREKSATNIMSADAIGEHLDSTRSYKYLGMYERNNGQADKPRMMQLIRDKIAGRVSNLATTGLTARNMTLAINEYALTTTNYYIGAIDITLAESASLDKIVKDILYSNKMIRAAANIDRLYLPRAAQGRGLASITERAECMLLRLHDSMAGSMEMRTVLEQEATDCTTLSSIRQILAAKYNQVGEEFNMKQLRECQQQVRRDRIMTKKMHSRIFTNDDHQLIDTRLSSMWLQHGYLSMAEEATLTKLQDRNIFSADKKCMRCKTKRWTVDHVATNCGALLHTSYVDRHNEVVRYIHHKMCKRYGIVKKAALKGHRIESVLANYRVKIKSDLPIQTDVSCKFNRPDLLIHDKRDKKIWLVEVRVSSRPILAKTEVEKKAKYELLAGDLRSQHPGTEVIIVPVVIAWDASVTKHCIKHLKKIGLDHLDLAKMQIIAMKRTADLIHSDLFDTSTSWTATDEEDATTGRDGDGRNSGDEPIEIEMDDEETIIIGEGDEQAQDDDNGGEERDNEVDLVPPAAVSDVDQDEIHMGDTGTGELNVRESL